MSLVTKKKGSNHAEIDILNNNKIDPTDTLYVTLEPCFHDDTSPSCAKKLASSKIKNIIIGDIDLIQEQMVKAINILLIMK